MFLQLDTDIVAAIPLKGLHIGRSPAYSAEMIPDRCCLGAPNSSPCVVPPPALQKPHLPAWRSNLAAAQVLLLGNPVAPAEHAGVSCP